MGKVIKFYDKANGNFISDAKVSLKNSDNPEAIKEICKTVQHLIETTGTKVYYEVEEEQ